MVLDNIINKLTLLQNRFNKVVKVLNLEKLNSEIDSLTGQTIDNNFWSNSNNAQKVTQKLAQKNALKKDFLFLQSGISELVEFVELSDGNSTEIIEINQELLKLQKMLQNLEFITKLNGKYDSRNTIWTIRSGSGGAEAADWAKMLYKMYEKYLLKNGYKINILDTSLDSQNGYKSRVFEVIGLYSYGKFKHEAGTHRLIRISPFDHNKRRHTSFAAVEIVPELESDTEIEILPEDVKIDVYRSSGPGGQSVNTTDSAVRITHIPSGIVISMQNEKSQLQNKNVAFSILKAKLLDLQRIKEEKQKKELAGDIKASWGEQVRNYILNPFQLVKDVRTGIETANAQKVLSGDIDIFLR
jgi:peptide chain release factor 2